jgi:hypothetical protein
MFKAHVQLLAKEKPGVAEVERRAHWYTSGEWWRGVRAGTPDGGSSRARGNDEGKALSGADVTCTEILETDPASSSTGR